MAFTQVDLPFPRGPNRKKLFFWGVCSILEYITPNYRKKWNFFCHKLFRQALPLSFLQNPFKLSA